MNTKKKTYCAPQLHIHVFPQAPYMIKSSTIEQDAGGSLSKKSNWDNDWDAWDDSNESDHGDDLFGF